MQPEMTWTEPRIQTLRKLWNEGLTAAQIAARLGWITRNAVIGKADRLGLSTNRKRQTISRAAKSASAKKGATAARGETAKARATSPLKPMRLGTGMPPTSPAEPVPSLPEVDVPLHKRVHLLDTRNDQCRWIIGDPKTPEHHYCHHDRAPGRSYCAQHVTRMHEPGKYASTYAAGVASRMKTVGRDNMLAVRELIDDRAA